MENHLPPSTSQCAHPYSYLTFLNKLYSYYDQDSQKQIQKKSRLKLQTQSFKNMKVPDVLQVNYLQQQSLQNTSNKKKVSNQNKDIASGVWKEHAESLKKYRKQVSERRSKIKHSISANEEERICLQDHKNIFLKKLVRAGKIPSYDRQELESEVLMNLRTISSQNKWRTVTSRNIRSAHSATRPKSRVLIKHPMTAKPENREGASKSRQPFQFSSETKNPLGNKTTNSADIWDCMSLEKQAEELRYFDGSMSYKNVKNVQGFIDRIHELQNSIEDY